MKHRINYIGVFLLVGLLFACEKKEDLTKQVQDMNLMGSTWTAGEIDAWLAEHFLDPYNISVKYRWDRDELPLNRTLVPARIENVKAVMETIRDGYLKPYEHIAGETFLKQYTPKLFVTVGSLEYRDDGAVTLGTASAGRKIALYDVNTFSKSNAGKVRQVLHTAHHEFGHILHQTIMYDLAYDDVSAGDYLSDWQARSEANALRAGFITPYGGSQGIEDFVEVIATLLADGQDVFNSRVARAGSEGGARLREKERRVVEYFDQKWQIDFRALQQEAERQINLLVGDPPALHGQFGFTSFYKSITAGLGVDGEWSAGFGQVVQQVRKNLDTLGQGFVPLRMLLGVTAETEWSLFLVYHPASNPASVQVAVFPFAVAQGPNGAGLTPKALLSPLDATTIEIMNTRKNALFTRQSLTPLLGYFTQRTVQFAWPDGGPALGGNKPGVLRLTDVNGAVDFVSGTMGF